MTRGSVKVAADYMKTSGNTLDYSIMPFQAQNQKTVSALTSGDVPDLMFMDAPHPSSRRTRGTISWSMSATS